MKRYAVFAWNQYYPSGGMGNFKESFDDQHDAYVYAKQLEESDNYFCYDYVEIFDMDDFE